MKRYPRVLTVAGSDSGGGAGIQADIKAISATGSYAASAITAVTVQNTLGVIEVAPVPVKAVSAQIRCVLDDIGADAVKIGMLHSSEVVEAVAGALEPYGIASVVLDPVMVSTSGHSLFEDSALAALKGRLMPLARVVTPNVPEAEVLTGKRIRDIRDLRAAAEALSVPGRLSVLMKAGHMVGDMLTDVFFNAESGEMMELSAGRIDTPNTHGTGCTLSSALASYLAQGYSLDDAVRAAREYLLAAIRSGAEYSTGSGHGPVDHFWKLNAGGNQ